MKDLLLFLFFILIFLCAYTITTYSLISTSSFVFWSNTTHFTTIQHGGNLTNLEIFRSIVEWGTWKIFGSTSLTTTDLLDVQYSGEGHSFSSDDQSIKESCCSEKRCLRISDFNTNHHIFDHRLRSATEQSHRSVQVTRKYVLSLVQWWPLSI